MNCYIHVPFCLSKCGYCAFYSEACSDDQQHRIYLEHLEQQLSAAMLPRLETLYVGGGTPTALSVESLKRLLEILHRHLDFFPGAELSIEANPETLTWEKVQLLRSYFTRISVGVQSFDAVLRTSIGRRCSDQALDDALKLVKEAAFPHWNVDLMYALPGESLENWENDLRLAAGCGADHISCYSLTPESDAVMGSEFTEDDEREAVMFEMAEKILSGYGINRYEISNYARNGCECRHNQNVWRGGILYGFGPSAADFDGKCRHIAPASVKKWLNNEPSEVDKIPWKQRLNEIFAVNLRTVYGWDKTTWENLPGADEWENRQKIASFLQKKYPGALTITPDRIKLSATGILYWNNIAEEIL
jgi:oxygen-independent coproporphyrinogen-3 oxidase